MNIRPLESLTKEELIELIRHERRGGLVERPDEYAYFSDWYAKDAPDEIGVSALHMARHAWLEGIRFADLFPAAPQPAEPVKIPKEVIETLEGIVNADWRSWEELASPDEFVRWSKSRVSHTLALIAQYAYPDPVRSNHCEDILHMVPDGFKLVPDYKRGAHVKFEGVEYVIFGLGDTPGTFDIRPPRGISGDIWRNVPPHMLEILPQGTQPDHIEKDLEMVDPVVKDSLTAEPTDTERGRFECWAKKFMGMDITPNESCGYVSKKTLGAWYAWGAESRWRKRIDEAMRGEE